MMEGRLAIGLTAPYGLAAETACHKAHIAYFLTPEIPVGASDFPTRPELLHELDV